jgi:hypothetical protein
VFLLSASFEPKNNISPAPADIIRNVMPTDPYWNDFVAAFTAANNSFKDKLCSLDRIFVVQSTCNQPACQVDDVTKHSWGFRQRSSPPQRYIAVSETLWQNGTAPFFVDYENMRLQAVVQELDPINGPKWFQRATLRPRFSSASPNSTAMTLLAILAHEYGHVYWYDVFVVKDDGSPNPGGTVNIQLGNPALFCRGRFYTADSWGVGNQSITVPPQRWIQFGQRLPSQMHNPDLSGRLLARLSRGDFPGAGGELLTTLRDADIASLLASFSAIEDFVETYEWLQLLSASTPLTDLRFQIGGVSSGNLVQWISNKPGLRRRFACF